MSVQPPPPAPGLARPALAWRLHNLSREAVDAEVPIEIGGSIVAFLVVALTWFALVYWIFGSWFDQHPGDISGLLNAGIILTGTVLGLLTGGAVAGMVRKGFRDAYLSALGDLLSTGLPLVIADEALRGLVREAHESNLVRKWTRRAYSATLESQLQFASRYYAALLAVAQGRQPAEGELGQAGGCTLAPGWLSCSLVGVLGCIPGFNLLAIPLGLVMLAHSLSSGQQQKARLAALCDFYLGRDNSPLLRGWACKCADWPRLRGDAPIAPELGTRDITPGPFDIGTHVKREQE